MQETILKLQLQMRSKKRECIEQNAQIKGLTSKVRSLELFHAENDSRSSSLNNDLLTTSEERILEEDDENEEEIKSEILQPSEDGNSLDTVERNYLSNSSMRSKTEDIMKGDANYFSVPSRRKLDYYASSPRTQSEIFTPREERFPHQRAKETYSLGSLGVHNVPLSSEGNRSSNSFRNISLSKLENDNLKEETNPENESTLHSLTQNPLQNNTNNMYSLPLSSRKDYISSTSLSRINYYPLPSKKMDDFFTSTLKRTKDE
ncbi:unnamed protein product [Lepeophtheirus salmonis]|uniref:(salmon louse) hypothetical protein n=2 Tax=Lepeophtheirus salmonis TaxID=72036 RepID=A0A7R8H8M6_LEPSM|nr:unnamed protein product [Lepeophtheirus salmonis]CAF2933787.1 unnamed protein product [Lepeophtheirus salmonis]